MTSSTVTSRGQTTIPQNIRKNYHLQEGDKIEWVERSDGHIEIIPITRDAAQVAGLFKGWVTNKSVSIDEMNAAVKQAAATKFVKGLK